MAELNLAVDNLEVDLRQELMKTNPDSKKMRVYLKEMTDLNIKILDAAVDYSLKTKDVLANEQKQRLRHFFLTAYCASAALRPCRFATPSQARR